MLDCRKITEKLMKKFFNNVVRLVTSRYGVYVFQFQQKFQELLILPPDFDELTTHIYHSVNEFTMTSPERVHALIQAVKYIVINKIDGDIVECGVWKGGSASAIALTLKNLGDETRELYLYDTFSGMTSPTDVDVSIYGETALKQFSKTQISKDASNWCSSPLEEVRENVIGTGYPKDKLHFIKGKVEDTIPKYIPKKIALLRLDTDWYESTKHEMTHLFPLLSSKGVIIIDDYGHWEGARKAVDEYIAENNLCILLNRIDYTGRIAVKTL